jgi:hypothetical protein
MTLIRNVNVQASDSPSIDAFGRWRTSEPHTLFDSKQIFDNQALFWDDAQTSGAGTSSTYNTNQASTTIAVGNLTAGTRVRQTYMSFNYQPGKSQLIFMTAVISDGVTAGIKRRFGQFDANNGLFIELDGSNLYAARRTFTSGVAVDTRVLQSAWNIDPLNGTGPSGISLDLTKSQILIIDYEWLGVGRVRFGFVIDGIIYYCHQFLNANNLSLVYMSTPNLPLRYEISNDGTGAAAEFVTICSSVISEGGLEENGIVRSANLDATFVNANTIGTSYAMLGLRLKSNHIGAVVNTLNQTVLAATTDNFLWELRLNPTVAGVFTYVDEINSSVQIAKGDTVGNPSTTTVTGGSIIQSGYGAVSSAVAAPIYSAKYPGASISGTRDEVVLCVTPLGVNLDIYGSLDWREYV